MQQSAAMITGITEITQDASGAGNALRTISMRLRGTATDEEGEESVSTSKMRGKLKTLTGVDIMQDKDTYKSTYEIMKDIAEVWDDLTDVNKAAVLEQIAGKTRANQAAALLDNFEQVEKAYESSLKSAGVAQRENEIYLDSIEGKTQQLNASIQELANLTIDSTWIKEITDLLIQATEAASGFVGMFKKINITNKENRTFGNFGSWIPAVGLMTLGLQLSGRGVGPFSVNNNAVRRFNGPIGLVKDLINFNPITDTAKEKYVTRLNSLISSSYSDYETYKGANSLLSRFKNRVLFSNPFIKYDTNENYIKNLNRITGSTYSSYKDYHDALNAKYPRQAIRSLDWEHGDKKDNIKQVLQWQAHRFQQYGTRLSNRFLYNNPINNPISNYFSNRAIAKVERDNAIATNGEDARIAKDYMKEFYLRRGRGENINEALRNTSNTIDEYGNLSKGMQKQLKAMAYNRNIDQTNYENKIDENMEAANQEAEARYKETSIFSKIKKGAGKVFSTVGNMMVNMGVTAIISGIVNAIDQNLKSYENSIEKYENTRNNLAAMNQALQENEKNINDIKQQYIELSKCVDDNGNNVSLTTEEYKVYNEYANAIAKIMPDLVTGYTDQGNAILACRDNMALLNDEIDRYKNQEYGKMIAEIPSYMQGMNAKYNQVSPTSVMDVINSIGSFIYNVDSVSDRGFDIFKSEYWNNKISNTDIYNDIFRQILDNPDKDVEQIVKEADVLTKEKMHLVLDAANIQWATEDSYKELVQKLRDNRGQIALSYQSMTNEREQVGKETYENVIKPYLYSEDSELHDTYESLTDDEKKLAETILSNLDYVSMSSYMTVSEMVDSVNEKMNALSSVKTSELWGNSDRFEKEFLDSKFDIGKMYADLLSPDGMSYKAYERNVQKLVDILHDKFGDEAEEIRKLLSLNGIEYNYADKINDALNKYLDKQDEKTQRRIQEIDNQLRINYTSESDLLNKIKLLNPSDFSTYAEYHEREKILNESLEKIRSENKTLRSDKFDFIDNFKYTDDYIQWLYDRQNAQDYVTALSRQRQVYQGIINNFDKRYDTNESIINDHSGKYNRKTVKEKEKENKQIFNQIEDLSIDRDNIDKEINRINTLWGHFDDSGSVNYIPMISNKLQELNKWTEYLKEINNNDILKRLSNSSFEYSNKDEEGLLGYREFREKYAIENKDGTKRLLTQDEAEAKVLALNNEILGQLRNGQDANSLLTSKYRGLTYGSIADYLSEFYSQEDVGNIAKMISSEYTSDKIGVGPYIQNILKLIPKEMNDAVVDFANDISDGQITKETKDEIVDLLHNIYGPFLGDIPSEIWDLLNDDNLDPNEQQQIINLIYSSILHKDDISNKIIKATDEYLAEYKVDNFKFNIGDYATEVQNYEDKLSNLSTVMEGLKNGSFSAQDYIDLAIKYPSLAPYINDTDKLKEKVQELADESKNNLVATLRDAEEFATDAEKEQIENMILLIEQMEDVALMAKKVTDALNQMYNAKGTYENVVNTYETYGVLGSDDINSMVAEYSGMDVFAAEYQAGLITADELMQHYLEFYEADKQAYEDSINDKLKDSEVYWQKIKNDEKNGLNRLAKYYNVDLTNAKTYNEAKAKIMAKATLQNPDIALRDYTTEARKDRYEVMSNSDTKYHIANYLNDDYSTNEKYEELKRSRTYNKAEYEWFDQYGHIQTGDVNKFLAAIESVSRWMTGSADKVFEYWNGTSWRSTPQKVEFSDYVEYDDETKKYKFTDKYIDFAMHGDVSIEQYEWTENGIAQKGNLLEALLAYTRMLDGADIQMYVEVNGVDAYTGLQDFERKIKNLNHRKNTSGMSAWGYAQQYQSDYNELLANKPSENDADAFKLWSDAVENGEETAFSNWQSGYQEKFEIANQQIENAYEDTNDRMAYINAKLANNQQYYGAGSWLGVNTADGQRQFEQNRRETIGLYTQFYDDLVSGIDDAISNRSGVISDTFKQQIFSVFGENIPQEVSDILSDNRITSGEKIQLVSLLQDRLLTIDPSQSDELEKAKNDIIAMYGSIYDDIMSGIEDAIALGSTKESSEKVIQNIKDFYTALGLEIPQEIADAIEDGVISASDEVVIRTGLQGTIDQYPELADKSVEALKQIIDDTKNEFNEISGLISDAVSNHYVFDEDSLLYKKLVDIYGKDGIPQEIAQMMADGILDYNEANALLEENAIRLYGEEGSNPVYNKEWQEVRDTISQNNNSQAEKELKDLKRQLDLREISVEEYWSEYARINDKYRKGDSRLEEEYLDSQQELMTTKYTEIYEETKKILDKQLQRRELSYTQYFTKSLNNWATYYANRKALAEASESELQNIYSAYTGQISTQKQAIDSMISLIKLPYEKQIEGLNKVKEKQDQIYDDQMEAIDDEIKEYDKKIKALEKQNQLEEQANDIANKAKAVLQSVRMVYIGNGQWTQRADESAVKDLEEAYRNAVKDRLEKIRETLEEQKNNIQEFKDLYDRQINKQQRNITKAEDEAISASGLEELSQVLDIISTLQGLDNIDPAFLHNLLSSQLGERGLEIYNQYAAKFNEFADGTSVAKLEILNPDNATEIAGKLADEFNQTWLEEIQNNGFYNAIMDGLTGLEAYNAYRGLTRDDENARNYFETLNPEINVDEYVKSLWNDKNITDEQKLDILDQYEKYLGNQSKTNEVYQELYKESLSIKGKETKIETNTDAIKSDTSDIKKSTDTIAENINGDNDTLDEIANNTSQIADNTEDISDNATDIAQDTAEIQYNSEEVIDKPIDIAQGTAEMKYDGEEVVDDQGGTKKMWYKGQLIDVYDAAPKDTTLNGISMEAGAKEWIEEQMKREAELYGKDYSSMTYQQLKNETNGWYRKWKSYENEFRVPLTHDTYIMNEEDRNQYINDKTEKKKKNPKVELDNGTNSNSDLATGSSVVEPLKTKSGIITGDDAKNLLMNSTDIVGKLLRLVIPEMSNIVMTPTASSLSTELSNVPVNNINNAPNININVNVEGGSDNTTLANTIATTVETKIVQAFNAFTNGYSNKTLKLQHS